MMKRGFTIIEVLVASLLLGMLVSILTMMFNQSSIAWRTGVAAVEDLDEVRINIANLRDEADNAYVWNNQERRIIGLWDASGDLRERAWNVDGESGVFSSGSMLNGEIGSDTLKLKDLKQQSVGGGRGTGGVKTYTVNVKSAGPDREFNTFDDIWSYPDEIN
ncbi:MAG: type II secretion system protein [Kiritimatiellae bacterium]|nr:type II secretion system protein [Kiritimatiellia bacterium]